ncbi:hypothetical protein JL722_5217 [Aureococcus anophagefferens]|nr:hypothetical protein JL722_5217 [Aureococcus anophagefferens]
MSLVAAVDADAAPHNVVWSHPYVDPEYHHHPPPPHDNHLHPQHASRGGARAPPSSEDGATTAPRRRRDEEDHDEHHDDEHHDDEDHDQEDDQEEVDDDRVDAPTPAAPAPMEVIDLTHEDEEEDHVLPRVRSTRGVINKYNAAAQARAPISERSQPIISRLSPSSFWHSQFCFFVWFLAAVVHETLFY